MANEGGVEHPRSNVDQAAQSSKTDSTANTEPTGEHHTSEDTGDISVSVSTTFFPTACLNGDEAPDLLMLTSDSVFFYVHSSILLRASENRFGSLVPLSLVPVEGQSIAAISSHRSNIVNLVLHAAYKLPCLQFSPTFDEISAAIGLLSFYGMQPLHFVNTSSPLFSAAKAHASTLPMEVYVMAARLDLFDLAAAASSHLLSTPLSVLTDELASRIGPLYLKRLITLHVERMEKLKELFLTPPPQHNPTAECNAERLNRAWSFATAPLAWEIRPDISAPMMKAALLKGENQLTCVLCRQHLHSHIDSVVEKWVQEKRTI